MLKPKEIYPKVGITIMVIKDGRFLLGKRKGSHGAGQYAFPGGSLEYMETIADCVHREIAEEVGIEVGNIRFVSVYNLRDYPPKHFIDVAMMVDWISGEPKVLEPDKCESWSWYDPGCLPEPLFNSVEAAIMAEKEGICYIES